MFKTKKQRQQEERLRANVNQTKKTKKDYKAKQPKVPVVSPPKPQPPKKKGGFFNSLLAKLFGSKNPPNTAQKSIPYG